MEGIMYSVHVKVPFGTGDYGLDQLCIYYGRSRKEAFRMAAEYSKKWKVKAEIFKGRSVGRMVTTIWPEGMNAVG
jgi:hypothetical protein